MKKAVLSLILSICVINPSSIFAAESVPFSHQLSSGLYSTEIPAGGQGFWFQQEGILGAYTEDWDGDGEDETLVAYVKEGVNEFGVPGTPHDFHLAVLSGERQIIYDVNLGYFDYFYQCDLRLMTQEFQGTKYIIIQFLEHFNGPQNKFLVFHMDSSDRLCMDACVYETAEGAETYLDSLQQPGYYTEIPYDSLTYLITDPMPGNDSGEEMHSKINQSLNPYGLSVKWGYPYYGSGDWVIVGNETLTELSAIMADAQRQDIMYEVRNDIKGNNDQPEAAPSSSNAASDYTGFDGSTISTAYVFEDSNTRALSREELVNLSQFQLLVARNEIYARHGRMFQMDALVQYFSTRDWYHPTIPADQFNDFDLSELELANARLILDVEHEKGIYY